jgi:hypothetical protein
MHTLDWRHRTNTVLGKPGNVPIADGDLRMASVIADHLDKSDAR